MKQFLCSLAVLCLSVVSAQEDFLAKQYFNDGDFDKAVVYYEKLAENNPRRTDYTEGLVLCYHQLEAYDKAISFLSRRLEEGNAYPTLLIDMGYTYLLMDRPEEAEKWYRQALETIESNPNFGYGIGFKFQRYTLLDYALQAYSRAMELNPELDFNFQIARIYGEQGRIGEMFDAYMDLLQQRESAKANVLRVIESFIGPDPEAENNQLLRRVLLTRAQKDPDPLWNELLSWLYLEQGQYANAFNQEKAIYRRVPEVRLDRMVNLGRSAEEAGAVEAAVAAFEFVVAESNDPVSRLNARLHLIDIGLADNREKDLREAEQAYEELMDEYGYAASTLQLQVAYAKFLAFRLSKPDRAIRILKNSLDLPLPEYAEGYVKLSLGDILVFDQRFNEALILFSQIQKLLKNDVMGQQARFKVAQTSFYKGDFDWALTQLKVLRNSTSQLIANDAMQLSLIISDNSLEDSTQTALRKYARADLLAYQQKNAEALAALDEILTGHKGEKIEDEALLMHGRLLEAAGDYSGALLSYRKIVEFFGQDILADDAHFAMGELYRTRLEDPAKAMEHYREIIYRFQDSYHFPEARKQFRRLRGDPVN
ncbi:MULTISPECIES: tetratricopeptide repeat protein [Robiginitalea]|uniref:Tetratricopeptide repeat domain protein n=1 Tax=Robiginitalea biformata (strain ATCC BAA-864 / DSM 15991 / KCTC 12146 / HTCC2501) TaxID=313596 RepID=A4CH20_ROBBH|nr:MULTISPECIES: tetratricopeptide repeat protein [Robiginitalea]EAR16228.1 tetratricopeptide repeat domain protein [Robiginitalea biformata HTCC2501]MDC6353497.1 tetratricopeptide repeat protein [Robiginitalea sp. PM2]MDC6373338.1 tetratricopeptide repeat protein [Robiginitalea sp. SP8]